MEVAEIKRIAVVGAGLMGHGIAQEFAAAGYGVGLYDVADERLRQARTGIAANLAALEAAGIVAVGRSAATLARIKTSTDLGETVGDADVVIEAAPEDLPLKQSLFGALDRLCPSRTILASNTSSFPPSTLAGATRRPDRVLVTHYFNPPYLLPLVEVVRGSATSDATMATVVALMEGIGKRPAVVQREAPGFIGNRLQHAVVREALSIVRQGIATPEEVDKVIKHGFGRRMAVAGIFETSDAAGLDVVLAVAGELFPAIESSSEVPSLLRAKVERGELGLKSGTGFYDWPPGAAEALRARIRHALIEISRWA